MSNSILNTFNSDDVADISALIDKLEKSSFDYLKLEGGGVSIVIGKNGAGEYTATEAARTTPTAPVAAAQTGATQAPGTDTDAQAAATIAETAAKPAIPEQEGIVLVRSPNYGLFYAQVEPGAPPYVTIGATVKAGDTVGLLETMKTFTAISSPVDGEVVAIHVKNEETLEPDQPLISIKI